MSLFASGEGFPRRRLLSAGGRSSRKKGRLDLGETYLVRGPTHRSLVGPTLGSEYDFRVRFPSRFRQVLRKYRIRMLSCCGAAASEGDKEDVEDQPARP